MGDLLQSKDLLSGRVTSSNMQAASAGSAFAELGGFHTIEAFGNHHIGSTLNLVRCRFTDNYAAVAVLTANGDAVSVRIEQSVFADNTLGADSALLESQGDSNDSAVQFFSDASIPVHDIFSSQRSTLSLADWPEGIGLTAEDPFLAGLQQVRPLLPLQYCVYTKYWVAANIGRGPTTPTNIRS